MDPFDFNPGSTGPLLHLANANGFPVETYRQTFQPLLDQYHVVSVPARPWWGTTPADWLRSWEQMADDLLEGLEELGFRGGVGIGHSLGAVLTLYAAVRRPGLFSRVILIDPTMLPPLFLWKVRLLRFVGLDARPRLVEGALRRRRTWESGEAAYRYFRERKNFMIWSDSMVRAYTEGITVPSPLGGVQLSYPPEWEARIYQTIPTDVWKKASLLHIPTLVIRGEVSNTFTAESERAFRKVFPTGQFMTISGAGHLAVQEKPDEVGRAILDFLQ